MKIYNITLDLIHKKERFFFLVFDMCQGLSKKGKKSLISNLFPRFIHDLMKKKKRKIQNIPITMMQHLYFYCRLSVKIMNAARQFKVNRQNLRKASDCRYTDQ